MDTLTSLLEAPALRAVLRQVAGRAQGRAVQSIALVEDLGQLRGIATGALAILTERASREAVGYRLDVAMRLAASRDLAAIVLTDDRASLPATAAAIAERAGLVVLQCPAGSDLARLLLEVNRELAGGAEATLTRVRTALSELGEAEANGSNPETFLTVAGRAVGARLEVREPGDDDIAARLPSDDGLVRSVCAPRTGGQGDAAVEIVVHLVAGALGRAADAARRAEEVPVRSRGVLIAQFLLAGPDRADRLLDRLRAAELAIDGRHTVVRLEIDNLLSLSGNDELASFELTERVGRLALDAARASGGVWHLTQVGAALLLVRMEAPERTRRAIVDPAAGARRIVERIGARVPGIVLVCGVGTTRAGSTGLRASAAEAHTAAAAARAARRFNAPVSFDEVGLRRTLIEWYASDAAREAVDTMLEPLDRLGRQRREVAIRTLQAYLDNQGSNARAAEELNLHRNAVAYRVRWIFETLDADPADPETRLMLQLACRARALV